jgi:hypothetical protein
MRESARSDFQAKISRFNSKFLEKKSERLLGAAAWKSLVVTSGKRIFQNFMNQ